MEFVHDDVIGVCGRTIAESDVGEDFSGAADDGSGRVDRGIAGYHTDVFRTEGMAEGKKFFVGKSFDRDGVIAAALLADCTELEGECDEGFARSGWGVENDVVAREKFQYRLFLVAVRSGAGFLKIEEKRIEDLIG